MTIIRRNILNSWQKLKFRNTQVETVSSPTTSFNTQESESLDCMINKEVYELKNNPQRNENKGAFQILETTKLCFQISKFYI